MIQANYSLDKFLKKVADLPVVRQMVHEESTRTNAEILKARMDCIALVKTLEIQEAKTREGIDSALAALKDAEEKVKPYRDRLIAANQPWVDAQRARQAAERSLLTAHGEGHVTHALYLLELLRNQCSEQITNLSKGLSTQIFVEGELHFRRVDPSIKPAMEKRKRDLEAIEHAYLSAKLLINAEMTPGEIKNQVDAILSSAGYTPNAEASQL
jgi:hypothetical protein